MTTPILHCPHPFRWPASRAPRRQLTHAHGAVPDYIIDYRSKRTCSIGFQSRFRDFCQDFKISGKISRFQARFQDFRQDFRDFKISGKISEISRFQARFPKDFKISIRFPKDFKDFVCECTRFQGVADPSTMAERNAEGWKGFGLVKGIGIPAPTGKHVVGCVDLMHKLEGDSDGLLVRLFYPAHPTVREGDEYPYARLTPNRMYTKGLLEFVGARLPGMQSWLIHFLTGGSLGLWYNLGRDRAFQ